MSNDIEILKKEVSLLKIELEGTRKQIESSYYFSPEATHQSVDGFMPEHGLPPKMVKSQIFDTHDLDFNNRLNTSSYVTVDFEPEEDEVALMGMRVNLADQTVYPQSYKLHDKTVNMIANLWNCPKPDDFDEYGVFPGSGTVGSTEACLLAGLALKFRWRKWFAKKNNLSDEEVLGKRPNIVMSTCYQAAWEKLFKYMDIEPRLISPSSSSFKIEAEQVAAAVDEYTIGVVCIMGNHYGGQYDPVAEIDAVLNDINEKHNFQIGIHVDAASGGFIAPFQDDLPAWDFRLPNVLSISASGHKYGASVCGTGWVVWRKRKDLSEHVAISVTYLGGKAESYTLNFSRPASGVYVQYYKFLRYGIAGYQQVCSNMMTNAQYIREGLGRMEFEGKPRFVFLDDGSEGCLPVVTAMLNPECGLSYDDIDLQHILSQHHWYVSGYKMGLNDPITEEYCPIFSDADKDKTMFRIVVKNNLTRDMAINLLDAFCESFKLMDSIDFSEIHNFKISKLRHKDQKIISNHC